MPLYAGDYGFSTEGQLPGPSKKLTPEEAMKQYREWLDSLATRPTLKIIEKTLDEVCIQNNLQWYWDSDSNVTIRATPEGEESGYIW